MMVARGLQVTPGLATLLIYGHVLVTYINICISVFLVVVRSMEIRCPRVIYIYIYI